MKTIRRLSQSLFIVCLTLGFAACFSPGGGHTAVDAGVTCHHGGKTYKPGQGVALTNCSRCVCLADGTLGMCSDKCPDARGVSEAATDSIAKLDGATIDAPADNDAPTSTDIAPKIDTVTNTDVAPKADTVTNTDAPKADTVADSTPKADDAGTIDVAPKPDTTVTCSYGGKTYAIGEIAMVSTCTSCICQADGTLGRCTGACTDGGVTIPDAGLAELCTSTGGYVIEQECCPETSDFPSTCGIGACGCGSTGHRVDFCVCPDGCFAPTQGCVSSVPLPNTYRALR